MMYIGWNRKYNRKFQRSREERRISISLMRIEKYYISGAKGILEVDGSSQLQKQDSLFCLD